MAVCFQLYRKATGEGPLSLNLVDEEICREFKAVPHPTRYFQAWYNNIGFMLACGKTWQDIRGVQERYLAQDLAHGAWNRIAHNIALLQILRFMESNYSQAVWAEFGRRD